MLRNLAVSFPVSSLSVPRSRVWTRYRKWMGNILPAAVWLPLVGVGLYIIFHSNRILGPGLVLVALAQPLAFLVVNYMGLFQNREIRFALWREVQILRPHFRGYALYCGFSSLEKTDLLDPHEDVGFVLLTTESLEFVGDGQLIRILPENVTGIRYRPNVHTLLGLGRWVCVEGKIEERKFHLCFEPREKKTLLANRKEGKVLHRKLKNWVKATH